MSTPDRDCLSNGQYNFKPYPIDIVSTNGVFHIYLPKNFFQFMRKDVSKRDKDSLETGKFFLEGQVASGPLSCTKSKGTTVCSITGLRIYTENDIDKKNGPQTAGRRRSSRLDRSNKMRSLEDPNIIGEICIGRSSPSQRQDILSRFWMTLQVDIEEIKKKSTKDIYFPVELISIKMKDDTTARHLRSRNIIWMYYNPKEVKYLHFQQLENSGLPPVVAAGFTQNIPYPMEESGWERISFQEKPRKNSRKEKEMVPLDQSKYLGGYEGNYFESTDGENFLKMRSAGMDQLLYKLYLFKGLVTGRYGLDLRLLNLLTILVLDFIMGYYFTRYLLKFPSLYSILHSKIGDLLEILLRLLHWLRGSPAGLKLNAELNSLLWRFFSYHLHLWRNYIGILEPILSTLLSTVIHAGVVGLSVQISLIQDLLSMATFHVYCLYIYASRLFSVQQVIVISLGRLFMGRKWNPLRSRIDHVRLTKLEMFLGALAFTIGIFLIPTTLVYYFVFLSLRLPVLIIESVLAYFVTVLNTCRIITNFLILSNSPRVCDEIFLDPILEDSDSNHESSTRFLIRVQNTKSIWRFPRLGPIITKLIQDIIRGKVLN